MVTDELFALANEPDMRSIIYSGCMVNVVRFLTEEEDKHRITQNSGVNFMDSYEDGDVDFYGALRSVLELGCPSGCRVVLCKCKWFDTKPKTGAVTIDCNIADFSHNITWGDDCP